MQRDRKNLLILGQQIRRLRKERKISQEELADRAGVHRNFIGYIERGERAASVLVLFDIAQALDVAPVMLFEVFEEPPAKLPVSSTSNV